MMLSYLLERKSFMLYSFYSDLQVLNDLPLVNLDSVVASSEDVDVLLDHWSTYMTDESVRKYNYTTRTKGKKYQHRFGYTLEVLIPHAIQDSEYFDLAHSFMDSLLTKHKKVGWIAERVKRGNGAYLKFTLCLSKRYKSKKEFVLTYEKDIYRDASTGYFTSADNKNAIKVSSAGDVKKVLLTDWSKKIRLFEMSRSEFSDHFIPLLENLLMNAVNKLHNIKKARFLRYIKHKTLYNRRKSCFYNSNIRYFNRLISSFNTKLAYWDKAIYSEAKFYQDAEVISSFRRLKSELRTYTKRGQVTFTFSNREFKFSLNPWINVVSFRQNIEVLERYLDLKLNKFLNTYIFIQ